MFVGHLVLKFYDPNCLEEQNKMISPFEQDKTILKSWTKGRDNVPVRGPLLITILFVPYF